MRHARQDLAKTVTDASVHRDIMGINVNLVRKSETRVRVDMNFLFLCSTLYLTHSLSTLRCLKFGLILT